MRGDRSRNPIGGTTSEPSESELFAQELLGRPVHVSPQPDAETGARKELREWVDSISTPDKAWGSPVRPQRGNPRTSPEPASEAIAKQELREWVESITRGTFNPDLHPRGGNPGNIGQFSTAGGGAGTSSRGATPHGSGQGSTDPGQLKRAERTRGVGGHEHSAKTPDHADQVAQVGITPNPDTDLDPELFLTPKALILTTQDNYEDGKTGAGSRYPENHDWNELAKKHGGKMPENVQDKVPDNYRTTAGTFDKQLQDLNVAGKKFDTLVLAGHGGPISPSIRWVTQRASPDGTKKEESDPFPDFHGPGSELSVKDKKRLDHLKSLVKDDGRIIFNSCNEDIITDPAKLKAHTDQMRKNMQKMADYTGREVWAYPEETRGMMIPKGWSKSAWLKVKPK